MWFNTPRDMSKMPADLFAHSDVEDDVVTMDSETVFNESANQTMDEDWTLAEIGPWKDDRGDDASTSEGFEDADRDAIADADKEDASKETASEGSDDASDKGSDEPADNPGDAQEGDGADGADGADNEEDEDDGELEDDSNDDIGDESDDDSDIQEGGASARTGFVEDVHTMYKSLSPRSKTCQHVIALSLVTMMCSFLGGVAATGVATTGVATGGIAASGFPVNLPA